jgi:hypothetical protein
LGDATSLRRPFAIGGQLSKKRNGIRILPIGLKWQSIIATDAVMTLRGKKGYAIPLITLGDYGIVLMSQKKKHRNA